jgi:hypothetical protein
MFSFLLRHAFFLAFCTGVLCAETSLVLDLDWDVMIAFPAIIGTLLAYNAYLYIGEAHATGGWLKHRNAGSRLFLIIIFGSVLLIFLISHAFIIPVFLISVVMALFYFLRLFPDYTAFLPAIFNFVKPLWLALIWSFVTVYFVAIPHGLNESSHVHLIFIQRLLFLLPICLIFEKKEWTKANAEKIQERSYGRWWSIYFFLAWISFMLFTCWQFHDFPERMSAYLLSGLTVLVLFIYAGKERGYFYYALLTDGLMLLPFLLMQIHRFWLTCLYN